MSGRIIKISGPLVVAENMRDSKMLDIVYVGDKSLLGEIVELHDDKAYIQVYEDTSLLSTGEAVSSTNHPLSIELAPGLIGGIFDGIARPLDRMSQEIGPYIKKGTKMPTIDREKKWHFVPTKNVGDTVKYGDELGYVAETSAVKHRFFVPKGQGGTLTKIKEGDYTVTDTFATIENGAKKYGQSMLSVWPIRIPRPYVSKLTPKAPLVTGQRVIDALFPIAKGGIGAVPGPFGSGKTVVQHQIAKWADADIIVYVGCGERGNEMTDVLNEFPKIVDPRTGASLMEKTILIANTSDMPVPAREASIYTGMAIAEYFRDMGYDVAIMADSTSRFAEALREMSARLEEMPSEEGYPAYLGSRLSQFYERAGVVNTLSGEVGSITAIGAVSPAGGDLNESVSQATLKVVKVFWALSSHLAYIRHFPAIDYSTSYSLYLPSLTDYYEDNYSTLPHLRHFALSILQRDKELEDIVHLVGYSGLGDRDRLILFVAKMIKDDFLNQNAFDSVDTFTSLNKSCRMLGIIESFYQLSTKTIDKGVSFSDISALKCVESIAKMRYIAEKDIAEFDELLLRMKQEFSRI